jgi:general secretion pathway protein D
VAPDLPPVKVRWRAPADVKPGETFGVTLELESAVALRGAAVHLRVAGEVEFVDVEEGTLFRAGGVPSSFTKASGEAPGVVRAGVLRGEWAQGTAGATTGPLVVVQLRAKAAGVGELELLGVEALAASGPNPPAPLPRKLGITVR